MEDKSAYMTELRRLCRQLPYPNLSGESVGATACLPAHFDLRTLNTLNCGRFYLARTTIARYNFGWGVALCDELTR